mmetsp:Transcript_107748/g.315034  ORF Transcript_107748/g.315034 Transcript_107748/m.315034 type:complete len:281 (-) Transcript_107748:682-1524(-)
MAPGHRWGVAVGRSEERLGRSLEAADPPLRQARGGVHGACGEPPRPVRRGVVLAELGGGLLLQRRPHQPAHLDHAGEDLLEHLGLPLQRVPELAEGDHVALHAALALEAPARALVEAHALLRRQLLLEREVLGSPHILVRQRSLRRNALEQCQDLAVEQAAVLVCVVGLEEEGHLEAAVRLGAQQQQRAQQGEELDAAGGRLVAGIGVDAVENPCHVSDLVDLKDFTCEVVAQHPLEDASAHGNVPRAGGPEPVHEGLPELLAEGDRQLPLEAVHGVRAD